LKRVDFERYSSIKSPFGVELEYHEEFLSVLNFIAKNNCSQPCRKGGGCGGHPCKIMKCAEGKKIECCWQCEKIEDCDKFDILEPRCGDTPKQNLKKIKKLGYEDWIKERGPFYIWQQIDSS